MEGKCSGLPYTFPQQTLEDSGIVFIKFEGKKTDSLILYPAVVCPGNIVTRPASPNMQKFMYNMPKSALELKNRKETKKGTQWKDDI